MINWNKHLHFLVQLLHYYYCCLIRKNSSFNFNWSALHYSKKTCLKKKIQGTNGLIEWACSF